MWIHACKYGKHLVLVSVRCFPSPYRSIRFADVSEVNRRETPHISLGPRDPKRFGRAE